MSWAAADKSFVKSAICVSFSFFSRQLTIFPTPLPQVESERKETKTQAMVEGQKVILFLF